MMTLAPIKENVPVTERWFLDYERQLNGKLTKLVDFAATANFVEDLPLGATFPKRDPSEFRLLLRRLDGTEFAGRRAGLHDWMTATLSRLIVLLLITVPLGHSADGESAASLLDASRPMPLQQALEQLDRVQERLDEEPATSENASQWRDLAHERSRRWASRQDGHTRSELDQLFTAWQQACERAVEAKAWILARDSGEEVLRTIEASQDFAYWTTRYLAADALHKAMHELHDRRGEGLSALKLYRMRESPVLQIGETMKAAKERKERRAQLAGEIRALLAGDDEHLLELDLEILDYDRLDMPVPERIQLLREAEKFAAKTGKPNAVKDERQRILEAIREAIDPSAHDMFAESLTDWSDSARSEASAFVREELDRKRAESQGDDPIASARALLSLAWQAREYANVLRVEVPSLADIQKAVATLPTPGASNEAASVWMWASTFASEVDPGGTDWATWAERVYRERPGYANWTNAEGGGEVTARDWESRAGCEKDQRVVRSCREHAGRILVAKSKEPDQWDVRLRGERLLADAGVPVADPMRTPDPEAESSLGPDAVALDQACADLGALSKAWKGSGALENIIRLLHLHKEEGIDLSQWKPYIGPFTGMMVAKSAWHLGVRACADLEKAADAHPEIAPAVVEIIGHLGGKNAAPVLERLVPAFLTRAMPWGDMLPAIQAGAPDLLASKLDAIIAATKDDDLKTMGYRAGRCLPEPLLERVVNEIMMRGNGEIVQGAVEWQAQKRSRINPALLIALWSRFGFFNELTEDIISCVAVTNDSRIDWWLLALVMRIENNEFVRARAIDAIGLRRVASAVPVLEFQGLGSDPYPAAASLLALAALGHPEKGRERMKDWIDKYGDDPEQSQGLAARCLRLALDHRPDDLEWVKTVAAIRRRWPRLEIINDLCRTRLSGAIDPVMMLVREDPVLRQTADKEMHEGEIDILARSLSLLPLEGPQRADAERLLGRSIPSPTSRAIDRPSWMIAPGPRAPGLE